MLRLVHIADVHLDTVYRSKDEETRQKLTRSCEEAFVRAVDLCLDQKVHALVIAGDLFDHDRWTFRAETFLCQQLARLQPAGVTTVVVTGNHDPGDRARRIPWPPGVVVMAQEVAESVDIKVQDQTVGRITGIGHVSDRVGENLVREFPPPRDDVPHVAVAHAFCEGTQASGRHERYAPCGREDFESLPYDYWALGHVHVRQQVSVSPCGWYSGNVQGRHPRETGSKGALLVTIEAPGAEPRVDFHPLARVRFESLSLHELDDVETAEALTERIRDEWQKRREADPGRADHDWFLRIELVGFSPLAADLPESFSQRFPVQWEWEDALCAALDVQSVELKTSRFRRPVDVARHRDQPHLLGEALKLMEAFRHGEEIPESLLALRLAGGPADESQQPEYVKELLQDLDQVLVERMLESKA